MTATATQPTLTVIDRKGDHEAVVRPLSLKLIARLWGYTRPYARQRSWILFLVITRAALLPALAWLVAYVLYGPIMQRDLSGLVWGAIGFGTLAMFTCVHWFFRLRLAQDMGESVVHDLRNRMFEHLQRMPMTFFDRTKTGAIISRFNSDLENVRSGVQDVLFVSLVNLGQMIIAATVMLYTDAVLFGVILLLVPVLWTTNRFFRNHLSHANRAAQESFSRVTATLAESVNGVRVTQGFVRQDVNASMFGDLVIDHASYRLEMAKLHAMFVPLLELNAQFFIAILFILGGWRLMDGGAEASTIITFLMMAEVFFRPIRILGTQYTTAMMAMAGAERVFMLLDTPPQWTDAPDAKSLRSVCGHVAFENVTFGYDPATPVLHDIDFVANPGQTIALVGHTGSGKSSIINLIAKFYLPTNGRVLIDGHDITTIQSRSLQRRMGIVLQQNFLFSGSVLDNIRVGRPQASDADVVDAARRIDCLDMINALPDGMQTMVGERGGQLSLGQRQLVCFARAMLADPRILILDEATSSVDTVTEVRIQRALELLLEDRTSFVVAHRLSTIRHADLVLVLHDGQIVERGKHADLLGHGGIYANLYRQFILASEG